MLWQDYEHDEGTIRFTDILSILCGETFGVRVPGAKNMKVRNKAPLFCSGRTPIRSKDKDPAARETLNGMMDERFTVFHFTVPLPQHLRQADWPVCGRCAALLYLQGPPKVPITSVATPSLTTSSSSSSVGNTVVASPGQDSVAAALDAITRLFASAYLTEQEFKAAKQRVLS